MGDAGEIQLQIRGAQEQPSLHKDATASNQQVKPSSMFKQWQWWLMVALNIFFLLAGQTVATLLGRLYYNEGGNSKWMATLVQSLTFQKVLKIETFSVVLQMQICTSFVASIVSVVGLFASGEWRELQGEMDGFEKGRVSYVMTLVWTAVAWQVASVGIVGLIFIVSSLFSNVISTVALPVVPIFAVIFFHDKMDGVKVMAMLIAIWGFISYIYQHYLDDSKAKRSIRSDIKNGSGDPIPP